MQDWNQMDHSNTMCGKKSCWIWSKFLCYEYFNIQVYTIEFKFHSHVSFLCNVNFFKFNYVLSIFRPQTWVSFDSTPAFWVPAMLPRLLHPGSDQKQIKVQPTQSAVTQLMDKQQNTLR